MKIELNQIATTGNSEIDLFRKMSSILSSKYNVTFIEETHQQYVEYKSAQIGQIARREISDLWIISFSPTKQKARMTFLQAKYHRANLNQHLPTFYGDFFQFELLSQRPILTNVVGQKYNFPLDILSFSCCSSVGSYGVFFIDSNKQIDLAYCSAEYLSTTSSLPTFYKQKTIDLNIPYFATKQLTQRACGCSELVSCFDIDTFTNSILSFEIGVEISFYPNILGYVQSVIKNNNNSVATNQFINFTNNFQITSFNDNTSFDGTPISILIINTDERKEV